MTDDERRRSTRVFFHTTASLHFEDADFSDCETANLSIKSVFIKGITGRALGDQCEIELHLSGSSSQLSLQMQGEVTRIVDGGIGIKFFETDLDSFYHLKNIVYYNSGNPDGLTGKDDPEFTFEGEENLKGDFR